MLWRIRYHRHRYGSAAIVAFDRAHWREFTPELALVVLGLVLTGEALAWAFWPQALMSLAIVPPMVLPGLLMLGCGLLIVLRAQSDLGASWRIGIDQSARPGLIAHGLYRYSRNPIYVGAAVVVAGFALLMPTALSILVVAGLAFAARAQVVREELYLAEAYGRDYRRYAAEVRRFLPGIGRRK
jgi:protein-S-isoprenylcysteine O-methyltransferase Ste14